jgi:uncharacterized membrane protein YfcA
MLVPSPEPAAPAEAVVTFDRKAAVVYPVVVGLMSGLVGAGGAFLITPVLLGLLRLPLRLSIGTSLAIAGLPPSPGSSGSS